MIIQLLSLAAVATALPKRQTSIPAGVPDFVTKYAPVIYLYSSDPYLPSDIGAQIANTKAHINNTAILDGVPDPLTLDNLDQLNNIPNSNGGRDIYLTSNDNPDANPRPQYLHGVKPNAEGKTEGAISSAIITVDKGPGIVDAFYFFFYAFDYGGDYFGFNIGNHVGDWEHVAIRFKDSLPESVYFSQHSGGQAFAYASTEKFATHRPVGYSANGTHATYAIPGTHDHTIPGVNLPAGPIEDQTDAGTIWDPTLSAYYYSYDPASNKFAAYDDATPVNWLYFWGKWGDAKYGDDDSRQECVLGIGALCKYTGGPTGPIDKGLGRGNVCPDGRGCAVLPILVPRGVWAGAGWGTY